MFLFEIQVRIYSVRSKFVSLLNNNLNKKHVYLLETKNKLDIHLCLKRRFQRHIELSKPSFICSLSKLC